MQTEAKTNAGWHNVRRRLQCANGIFNYARKPPLVHGVQSVSDMQREIRTWAILQSTHPHNLIKMRSKWHLSDLTSCVVKTKDTGQNNERHRNLISFSLGRTQALKENSITVRP